MTDKRKKFQKTYHFDSGRDEDRKYDDRRNDKRTDKDKSRVQDKRNDKDKSRVEDRRADTDRSRVEDRRVDTDRSRVEDRRVDDRRIDRTKFDGRRIQERKYEEKRLENSKRQQDRRYQDKRYEQRRWEDRREDKKFQNRKYEERKYQQRRYEERKAQDRKQEDIKSSPEKEFYNVGSRPIDRVEKDQLLDCFQKQTVSDLLQSFILKYPSIFNRSSQRPEYFEQCLQKQLQEQEPQFDSGDQFNEKSWNLEEKVKAAQRIQAECILTKLAPYEYNFLKNFDKDRIVVNDLEDIAKEAAERRRKKGLLESLTIEEGSNLQNEHVNLLANEGQSSPLRLQPEVKAGPFSEFVLGMDLDPSDQVWSFCRKRQYSRQLSSLQMDEQLKDWRQQPELIAVKLYQSQFVELTRFLGIWL